MAFNIKGDWVTTCSCHVMCPCPIDGPPSGKDGHCRGAGIFHIEDGSFDDTDLSGISVGMVYHAPGNFSAGNIKMGLVIDPSVPDDTASKLEQIFKGEAGGPFAQFVPLVGEWLGIERAPVKFSDGTNPSATIGGNSMTVRVATGVDGNPTVVKNAAQAWRAEGYQPGFASGKFSLMGVDYEAIYGEHSKFEFAS